MMRGGAGPLIPMAAGFLSVPTGRGHPGPLSFAPRTPGARCLPRGRRCGDRGSPALLGAARLGRAGDPLVGASRLRRRGLVERLGRAARRQQRHRQPDHERQRDQHHGLPERARDQCGRGRARRAFRAGPGADDADRPSTGAAAHPGARRARGPPGRRQRAAGDGLCRPATGGHPGAAGGGDARASRSEAGTPGPGSRRDAGRCAGSAAAIGSVAAGRTSVHECCGCAGGRSGSDSAHGPWPRRPAGARAVGEEGQHRRAGGADSTTWLTKGCGAASIPRRRTLRCPQWTRRAKRQAGRRGPRAQCAAANVASGAAGAGGRRPASHAASVGASARHAEA